MRLLLAVCCNTTKGQSINAPYTGKGIRLIFLNLEAREPMINLAITHNNATVT